MVKIREGYQRNWLSIYGDIPCPSNFVAFCIRRDIWSTFLIGRCVKSALIGSTGYFFNSRFFTRRSIAFTKITFDSNDCSIDLFLRRLSCRSTFLFSSFVFSCSIPIFRINYVRFNLDFVISPDKGLKIKSIYNSMMFTTPLPANNIHMFGVRFIESSVINDKQSNIWNNKVFNLFLYYHKNTKL